MYPPSFTHPPIPRTHLSSPPCTHSHPPRRQSKTLDPHCSRPSWWLRQKIHSPCDVRLMYNNKSCRPRYSHADSHCWVDGTAFHPSELSRTHSCCQVGKTWRTCRVGRIRCWWCSQTQPSRSLGWYLRRGSPDPSTLIVSHNVALA